jgi:hypothetical protein
MNDHGWIWRGLDGEVAGVMKKLDWLKPPSGTLCRLRFCAFDYLRRTSLVIATVIKMALR